MYVLREKNWKRLPWKLIYIESKESTLWLIHKTRYNALVSSLLILDTVPVMYQTEADNC